MGNLVYKGRCSWGRCRAPFEGENIDSEDIPEGFKHASNMKREFSSPNNILVGSLFPFPAVNASKISLTELTVNPEFYHFLESRSCRFCFY